MKQKKRDDMNTDIDRSDNSKQQLQSASTIMPHFQL